MAVLLIVGFQRATYSDDAVRTIQQQWAEVEALGVMPSPAPKGSTTAASFQQDLWRLLSSGKPAELDGLRDWLAGPGPHRLRAEEEPSELLNLLLVAQPHLEGWAATGDPGLLPGLAALAHGLATEGGPMELSIGWDLQAAVLERVVADGLDWPAPSPDRPDPDEAIPRALARRAVRLAREVDRDPSVVGGGALAGDVLEALGRETLGLALRQAAIRRLAGEPVPPDPPGSPTELLARIVTEGPEALEAFWCFVLTPTGSATDGLARSAMERYERAYFQRAMRSDG